MEQLSNGIVDNKYHLPELSGAIHALKRDPHDKSETIPFKLIHKKQITHDSFIFTFELPHNMYLGIDLGQHLAIDSLITSEEFPLGEDVSRKYTPISHIYEKGKFDLLIKVYYKTEQFPNGGKLTQWIDKVKIGTNVLMRGPLGRFHYFGNGNFKFAQKGKPVVFTEKKYSKVGMLTGGSGITPIFQLLLAAHLNHDTVEYSLIFGNRSTQDILLKEKLDNFYKSKHFKFNLHYTIDKDEENWDGLVGYIDKEKISKFMPPPSEETLILVCGSGKMCKKYLIPLLEEMGYERANIFKF